MFRLFYFYFWWFSSFCDAEEEEKIFGGRYAKKGEFPSVVAIMQRSMCAGMLVKMDKVVTAAHCLVEPSGEQRPMKGYTVYGGTLTVPVPPRYQAGEGVQRRYISRIIIHELYRNLKNASYFNDIAMVVLSRPFFHMPTCGVARFLTENEKEFLDAWNKLATSGKKCIGVGWGKTLFISQESGEVPGVLSEDLKAIDLTPLEQKTCRNYLKAKDKNWTKGEVCVSSKKGESVCGGDSGSPLFCDGYAFALARANIECGNRTKGQYYLLYGPYFDYFNRKLSHGSLLSTDLFIVSSTLILHYYFS